MNTLLKGGRVVDPSRQVDGTFDVLLTAGRITRIDRDIPVSDAKDAFVFDVPAGWVVCPGFIDMHVHLREPGQEHKETIATGTAAAVAGGFTAVACMPNTSPINDTAGITEFIVQKAREAGLAKVYPIGAVSRGSEGQLLADIAELRESGCVAVSDDGRPVATALLMRRALEYTGMLGIPVIDHCEDQTLKGDGVANEGFHASTLGLRGIPNLAESIMVQRDIALAGLTRGHVHIAHMSARESLDAVRVGKSRGIQVTCEVTPHHFVLTDEMLGAPIPFDTNVKMNPPLREAADRDALLQGLADGSIDAIATDHAPHHADEKHVEFDHAPFGITGLETAVSLSLDRLVHRGVIPLSRLVELLTIGPARILGLAGGTLGPGAPADVTLLAPDARVTVRAAAMRSRSRNTPFDGWQLRGAAAATIVDGRLLYVNPEVPGAEALAAHVEVAAGARVR
jgi:dihydroorotase